MLSDVGCGQDHKQPEVVIEVHVTALFINIWNCKKKTIRVPYYKSRPRDPKHARVHLLQ
jgi:hypothetical protein